MEKNKLGVLLLIGSEAIFFLLLIVAYVSFRNVDTGGPTAVSTLDPLLTGVFSLFLFSSSFTIWRAGQSLFQGRRTALQGWLLHTIFLGLVFLSGQAYEWPSLFAQGATINSNLFRTTFFTLTAASRGLDLLAKTWPIALALYFVRMGAIYIGAFTGGVMAREPMSHNRVRWMAFVTQAGVGLGLAREVAVEFPDWGPAFAAMIISLIVLNETTGPLFFKWAINHVGEAHKRGDFQTDNGPQIAVIIGLEGQGLALARQLQGHGWDVRIASRTASDRDDVLSSDVPITLIPDLNLETLMALEVGKASALVVMLSDEENYQICELAYEHCGTPTIVARLNHQANYDRFHDLGVLVVDPANAMVHVMEQFVRAPTAAALLMGMEEGQEIVDLEMRNPNLHGIALHDLRLPLDTLILSVHRGNQMLISHGYTILHTGDRVTVLGSTESLVEVGRRLSA